MIYKMFFVLELYVVNDLKFLCFKIYYYVKDISSYFLMVIKL